MKLSRTAIIIILALAAIETTVWLIAVLPSMRGQQQHSARADEQAAPETEGSEAAAEADGAEAEPGEAETSPTGAAANRTADATKEEAGTVKDPKLIEEMKKKLTPEQYNICFLKGTEPPGSGKYYKNHEPGEYHCAVCAQLLFKSETKFDSGTGWPSFWEMAEPGAITETTDESHGMIRTEVTCSVCGAHLGHVFNDGPPPSGLRYCINSLALQFVSEEEAQKAAAEQQGQGE